MELGIADAGSLSSGAGEGAGQQNQQMEVIRHQSIGQDPYAAKGLQPSHQEHKSFGLWGPVAGGLENELTVDHSGNAGVKTLTLSLDARESHGREADSIEQKIKV